MRIQTLSATGRAQFVASLSCMLCATVTWPSASPSTTRLASALRSFTRMQHGPVLRLPVGQLGCCKKGPFHPPVSRIPVGVAPIFLSLQPRKRWSILCAVDDGYRRLGETVDPPPLRPESGPLPRRSPPVSRRSRPSSGSSSPDKVAKPPQTRRHTKQGRVGECVLACLPVQALHQPPHRACAALAPAILFF